MEEQTDIDVITEEQIPELMDIPSKPSPVLIGDPNPLKRTCAAFVKECALIRRIKRIMGEDKVDPLRTLVYSLTVEQLEGIEEVIDEQLKATLDGFIRESEGGGEVQ